MSQLNNTLKCVFVLGGQITKSVYLIPSDLQVINANASVKYVFKIRKQQ